MPGQTPSLPHDPDAELIILGNCLLSASREPLGELGPQHFYSTLHSKVAQAIIALAESGRPINTLELHRHFEEHKNGITASDIAALTDGVPEIKPQAYPHYQTRLVGKLEERSVLWEANALGRAAESGETAVQIVERAEQLAAKGKAPKEQKEKRAYSDVPKAAWHAMAEMYRQGVADSTEASDNYHLACFLTAVGCLLGRSVFTRKGRVVYPNLFTVLVGRTGARKGTAMELASDLMAGVDSRICILESLDSRQGYITAASSHQKNLANEGITGAHRELLILEEFKLLLKKMEQKATSELGSFLCKLYDCRAREANLSKSGQIALEEVKEPTFSMKAGTTPAYLRNFQQEDIEGGAGNRICWVPGDPKARKDDPPDPDETFLGPVRHLIQERVEYYRFKGQTRLEFSDAAKARHRKWYQQEYLPDSGDEMIDLLTERDNLTVLKVAMINACLDGVDKYIELPHLEMAIAYVHWLWDARFPIFRGHGVNPLVKAQEYLLETVNARHRIGYAQCLPLMRRHGIYGQADHFRRLVSALADGGVIRIETVGGSRPRRYLVWNED